MRGTTLRNIATIGLVVLVYLSAAPAFAASPDGKRLLTGVEYLYPTEEDRQLRTTSVDLLYAVKTVDKARLSVSAGVTATRASGDITQWTGSLSEGTLTATTHESSASGLGPSALARFDLVKRKRVRLSADLSGGLLLYDQDFPAGGERYNFMWRVGPSLTYKLNSSYGIGVGYRWMHVSNGKGITAENPSYDAAGFQVQLSRGF